MNGQAKRSGRGWGTRLLALACVIAWTGCAGHAADKGGRNAGGDDTGGEGLVKEHRSGEWTPGLNDDEKATLFKIAEDTLAWCVSGRRNEFAFSGYELTDKLKVRTATFVTLKRGSRLRGCIGSLMPVAEMYRSVHDNAINAALNDYRFQPVTRAELPMLDVHISLLSPIVEIPSPDDFTLGENGIIISKGRRRSVYLPEVAIEQGWTKEETLSSLCEKAGLPPDAWREGTTFQVFSSVVLSK